MSNYKGKNANKYKSKAANTGERDAKVYRPKKGPNTRRNSKPNSGASNSDVRDCRFNKHDSTEGMNDISWYSKNPELLVAAARVPFPYKPGMQLKAGMIQGFDTAGAMQGTAAAEMYVPGILAINFAYSIGRSDDINSPASIAAREMYARVRAKYSGSLDADAPDIFMYCIALDQIHAYIAWMKRVYKTLTLYTPLNRDYPTGALVTMGFDANLIDELQKDKVKLWGYINTLVNMANKFTVPKDMPLYERHRWMNERIYLDSDHPGAQSYIFNPIGFYEVSATTEATKLTHKALSVSSADEMYQYGYELIAKLSEWDDAYTINGYLMRAYENSEWYTAALLAEDEPLQLVYNAEVLEQIHNLRAVGKLKKSTLTIEQDPVSYAIIHKPAIEATVDSSIAVEIVLDINDAVPDAADIVESSRLISHVVSEESGLYVHSATEIVQDMYILMNAGLDGGYQKHDISSVVVQTASTSVTSMATKLDAILRKSSFNRAPNVWYALKGGNSAMVCWYVGEVTNVTTISHEQLDEIDRVCLYSLFNCFAR